MELDKYFLVMLRRSSDGPEFTDDELDALQARHLAYLGDLLARGILALNGPVLPSDDTEHPYPQLRGLSFYATASAAEARAFAAADPMVQAGRLSFDLIDFLTRPGKLIESGLRITLED